MFWKPWQMKVQCSLFPINLLNYLCGMTSMGEGWWVSDLFFEDKLLLPVKHDGTYSLFFCTLREKPRSAKAFLFVLKPCAFQLITKKMKEKSTLSKNCERILVPVFQHCGWYPKHCGQRPHMGFGYYSCFVSCLFV